MEPVADPAADVACLLGGAKVLKGQVLSSDQLRRLLRNGLPYGSLEVLAEAGGIDVAELADLLGTSPRTLARRRQNRQRLTAVESDRVYRYARVLSIARQILGNADKARRWLKKPNRALGGDAPFDRLDTELGAREVETILGRIEHGVFG